MVLTTSLLCYVVLPTKISGFSCFACRFGTCQKTIGEIRKNSSITRKELADKVGISQDGVKYHLGNLKKLGIIKWVGPDKGGYWEVIDKK